MQPVLSSASAASRPPSLAANASYLCVQVGKAAGRSLTDGLAQHDVRPHHFAVLAALDDLGPSSQQDLCDALDIDKAHMCGFVDELLGRELVQRQRCEEDRRRYRVTISARGRALLDALMEVERRTQQEVFGHLADDEHTTLIALLAKVVDAADAHRLGTTPQT